MDNIKERFDQTLIDTLAITQDQIQPTAKFKEDLGADSLDMVELVMNFEKEFDISVPDEIADEIKTVSEAENYVLNLLKEKIS